MSTSIIGRAKSGKDSTKTYEVKWDQTSGDVYVSYSGSTRLPTKAKNSADAMRMAEAFLHDK